VVRRHVVPRHRASVERKSTSSGVPRTRDWPVRQGCLAWPLVSGIFISYRRKDAAGHAGRLGELLIKHYGRANVFMDIDSIGGGVDFRERIQSALDSSHVTLVLIGDNWLAPLPEPEGPRGKQDLRRIDREDDWVHREVAAALERDDVTVLPVLVDGARMPERSELPEDLSALPNIQYCELRNSEWPYDYRRLRRAIDRADPEGILQRLRRRLREGSTGAKLTAAIATLAVLGSAAAVIVAGLGKDNPTSVRVVQAPGGAATVSASATTSSGTGGGTGTPTVASLAPADYAFYQPSDPDYFYNAAVPRGNGWGKPVESRPTGGALLRTTVRGPSNSVLIIDRTPNDVPQLGGGYDSSRTVDQPFFGSATEFTFSSSKSIPECTGTSCVDYLIEDGVGGGWGVLAGGPSLPLAAEVASRVTQSVNFGD
jgi:hypothetical protein